MRLIICGGGTGGHIYPACSVYDKLGKSIPYCEKLYIGSKFGIEHKILKDKDLNFVEISARGFERGDYFYSLVSFFYFIKSLLETFVIMRKFKPDLVIGMGGFVSGPVILVAKFLGIDTMIHEQNVVPGLSTMFLARFAKKILYSYKESIQYFEKYKNKIYFTGNPVREEFLHVDREASRKKIGIAKDEILIISVGGSSGAERINDLSIPIADLTTKYSKVKYIHITGNYYKDIYSKKYDMSKYSDRVVVLPYSENMPELMSAADLMVSRAGAITIAEMYMVDLPGVLIPSPNVARDHQTYNARAFEKMGGSVLIKEDELSPEKISSVISDIIENPDKLNSMREAYSQHIHENALNTIISLIYDYNLS